MITKPAGDAGASLKELSISKDKGQWQNISFIPDGGQARTSLVSEPCGPAN